MFSWRKDRELLDTSTSILLLHWAALWRGAAPAGWVQEGSRPYPGAPAGYSLWALAKEGSQLSSGCLYRAPGKVKGTRGTPWTPGTWYPMIFPLQEGSAFHVRDPVLESTSSFSGLSGTGSTGEEDHSWIAITCPPQRLLVPLQPKWCGEEGEDPAVGPCTPPSPDPHRLQAALIPGPSQQGADALVELQGEGHPDISCKHTHFLCRDEPCVQDCARQQGDGDTVDSEGLQRGAGESSLPALQYLLYLHLLSLTVGGGMLL